MSSPAPSPAGGSRIFWFFGLSGSGKSTLAAALARTLRQQQVGVLELDGDRLRAGLSPQLGFSDADRRENIRRAAEVARLGVESGLHVVASLITPLEEHRAVVREVLAGHRLSLIYLDASFEVCARRDVKGLYARSRSGGVELFTGQTSRFEPPGVVDLVVDTQSSAPEESLRQVLRHAGLA